MALIPIDESPPKVETKGTPNWLNSEKETILLYGAPKVGKTWAYCSAIAKVIAKGNKVFLINTDGGISKTFKQYFGPKAKEVSQKVEYHFVDDMADVFEAVKVIKEKVKPNDWIIIDLVSDFWELAQHKFMEEASGGNILGYVKRMSENKKAFGLFEGSKWQYIKKLDNYVLEQLVVSPKCNVLGVAAEKDLKIEQAMTGKVKQVEFMAAGSRPAGQPQLSYKFNTIVFLGQQKQKRYFQVMGDRGAATKKTMISFDRDFWPKFLEQRKKEY